MKPSVEFLIIFAIASVSALVGLQIARRIYGDIPRYRIFALFGLLVVVIFMQVFLIDDSTATTGVEQMPT